MNIRKIVTKITTLFCIAGVVLVSNAPAVSAYEAHVINVTATIIDNRVVISPDGGKFCNDGKMAVEIQPTMENAEIFYTTNGSEPRCGAGKEYSEPFTLLGDTVIKAVACYEGKEGPVATEAFDISSSYCQTSLKINKVYYYADVNHGGAACDTDNEWVEIYNPTKEDINIKGWSICNSDSCDTMTNRDISIPAKGYAIITYKESTWSYWNIPEGSVKISLPSMIGSGLGNTADMVILKNASGESVDQMNWGSANSKWTNYNPGIWSKGVNVVGLGKILGRTSNGYDTDSVADWKTYDMPTVGVKYPNGGETWIVGKTYTIRWTADNPNGEDEDLSIDIYYSTDSGKTWANIVRNTDNDGAFEWRLPLNIKDGGSRYFTSSDKSRIKIVATDYTRNFMLTGRDVSDRDFCPPIDKSLLSQEELQILAEADTNGMIFVDSVTAAAMETADPSASSDDSRDASDIKQSDMLGREEDELVISGDEDGGDGDSDHGTDAEEAGEIELSAKTEAGTAVIDDADTDEHADISDEDDPIIDDLQNIQAAASDGEIEPDGDIVIEFNLNA